MSLYSPRMPKFRPEPEPPSAILDDVEREPRSRCCTCWRHFGGLRARHGRPHCSAKCKRQGGAR